MFKRISIMLVALLLLCTVFVNAQEDIATAPDSTATEQTSSISFSDVPEDSPYAEAVKKLVESGVIDGYEDGTFRPMNGVTRGEMCKMLNLSLGYIDVEGAQGFTDISEDDWFYPYALAAQKAGYIEGYEDGSFRGNNYITRQEVCAIVNRLLKPMDLGIEVEITDKVADWAKDHVRLVVMNQLMPLEENGTFRATENMKRHEHATLVSMFIIGNVKPITAEVKFVVNGEQYGETQTVVVGKKPEIPQNPTHTDPSMTFRGWRVVGEENVVDLKIVYVQKDMTFEAVFVKKTFKVDFYDGTNVYETQTVEYEKSPVAPEKKPERKGYIFIGWALTDGGVSVKLENIKAVADMSFYAVYMLEGGGGPGGGGPTYYDVIFYSDSKKYETQRVVAGNYPDKPKTDPKKTGYIFEGWSLKKNGTVVDVTKQKINNATNFYAVFKKTENDPKLLETLELGMQQLKALDFSAQNHKSARNTIVSCMKKVYDDAVAGEYINKEYVQLEYNSDVESVKSDLRAMRDNTVNTTELSSFVSALTNTDNVSQDVQDFLNDLFLGGKTVEELLEKL